MAYYTKIAPTNAERVTRQNASCRASRQRTDNEPPARHKVHRGRLGGCVARDTCEHSGILPVSDSRREQTYNPAYESDRWMQVSQAGVRFYAIETQLRPRILFRRKTSTVPDERNLVGKAVEFARLRREVEKHSEVKHIKSCPTNRFPYTSARSTRKPTLLCLYSFHVFFQVGPFPRGRRRGATVLPLLTSIDCGCRPATGRASGGWRFH